MAYIDKITNKDTGEIRPISPAADKVRVNNDNFEGSDLDVVLNEIAEAIEEAGGEGGYTPPQGGIPKGDLEQSVQDTLDSVADKVDKETGKGLSSNNYTDEDKAAVGTIASKANSADVYTKSETDAAISQAAIEAVVGNGDFAMTYDQASDTFNIVRLVPTLQVTQLSSMSASTKSGTFKVSGTNLKGNVTIAIAAAGWTLSDGTNTGQTLTLVPTDGTLAETTITAIYSGSTDSVGNTITVSSTNAEDKTVTANYTVTAGPTIFADTSKTIQAIAGDSATATIAVTASQLTEGITVIKGGDNANKFTVSPASLGTSGGTLTVQFSPASGDTTNQSATITLRSAGADDVVIALTGQVLVPSLSVSPASLDFSGSAGTATSAKQIVLTGANLLNDVAVTIPTGFSVTRNGSAVTSIAKEDVMASGGVTLDVVAAGTNESGSLAFAGGLASASVSLSWHETEVEEVGTVVTRMHGYASADAVSPTIGIKFRITALPSGNDHGQVKVVNSIGKCGYYTELNDKTNYNGAYRIHVPATVKINDNTYDVTELGGGCFGLSSSLNYISFEGPTNLKSFNKEKDSDAIGFPTTPFYSSPNFKGTSTVGNDNIMVYPYGVTSVSAVSGMASMVNKMYLPDTCTSFSAAQPASHITFVDLGTGFKAFNASLGYFSAPTIFILRSLTKVTIPNANVFNGWQGGTVIYVPSALISAYESDTNWAAGSDKITFAALEGSPYETSIYNN